MLISSVQSAPTPEKQRAGETEDITQEDRRDSIASTISSGSREQQKGPVTPLREADIGAFELDNAGPGMGEDQDHQFDLGLTTQPEEEQPTQKVKKPKKKAKLVVDTTEKISSE